METLAANRFYEMNLRYSIEAARYMEYRAVCTELRLKCAGRECLGASLGHLPPPLSLSEGLDSPTVWTNELALLPPDWQVVNPLPEHVSNAGYRSAQRHGEANAD